MKTIKINDITLRDIFQSIDPGDLNKKKLLAILEGYEGLKYDSLEIMGGSSFEKILETGLNMDPFRVCSFIKSMVTATPLQALIGTRNLIGMEIYDRSLMKKFIRESIKSGISIFRVYDSLNDVENFKHTVSEIVDNQASCQGTIIYDDLQNAEYYEKTAKKLVRMGCSSICIKDAESTMIPHRAAELFSLMSADIKVPVYFSASDLRGLQTLNYFEAAVNGCSGFDLSFLPSSYNDFTPTVFSFLLSLKGLKIKYEVDYQKITEQGELIKKQVYPFIKQDLFSSRFILNQTNTNLLPKWLISDINNQLVEIGEAESLDRVLEEVSKIKSEIGNPSLSTPVGQIVGSQAVLNSVVSDERWEIFSDEIKNLIQGCYGKLPRKIDKVIREKAGVLTEDGLNSLEETDAFGDCSRELQGITDRDEDILSYCFFPEKTRNYLENKKKGVLPRKQGTGMVTAARRSSAGTEEPVSISSLKDLDTKKLKEIASIIDASNIDEINFELDGIKISINNPISSKDPAAYRKTAAPADKMPAPAAPVSSIGVDEAQVVSPIVGTYYSAPSPEDPPFVRAGDSVKKGDTLFIVEAMKHMNRVNSEFDGTVKEILVQNEEAVEYGQTIMIIKKEH